MAQMAGKISENLMVQPNSVTGIRSPNKNDVLSGRGNFVNYHSGNKSFRQIVESNKVQYVLTPKAQKPKIASAIVNHVRCLDPPGRFLKQDDNTGLWNEIGDKKALDKTRQALREKAPEIEQSMNLPLQRHDKLPVVPQQAEGSSAQEAARKASVSSTGTAAFAEYQKLQMELIKQEVLMGNSNKAAAVAKDSIPEANIMPLSLEHQIDQQHSRLHTYIDHNAVGPGSLESFHGRSQRSLSTEATSLVDNTVGPGSLENFHGRSQRSLSTEATSLVDNTNALNHHNHQLSDVLPNSHQSRINDAQLNEGYVDGFLDPEGTRIKYRPSWVGGNNQIMQMENSYQNLGRRPSTIRNSRAERRRSSVMSMLTLDNDEGSSLLSALAVDDDYRNTSLRSSIRKSLVLGCGGRDDNDILFSSFGGGGALGRESNSNIKSFSTARRNSSISTFRMSVNTRMSICETIDSGVFSLDDNAGETNEPFIDAFLLEELRELDREYESEIETEIETTF